MLPLPPPLSTRDTMCTPSPRAPQPRAFILMFVLISLIVLLIMAMAYLRSLRIYHIRTSAPPDISSATTDILLYLSGVVGNDGVLSSHEPYDYPWTCGDGALTYFKHYPQSATGTNGYGNDLRDDHWLSWNEPVSNAWPQLSNVTGAYLDYTDYRLLTVPINAVTHEHVPEDKLAGPGAGKIGYEGVATGDARLVDTDGDGVGDAMWCYPPNAIYGDYRAIMAVRIVDAGAMLNLNVAANAGASLTVPRFGAGPAMLKPDTLVNGGEVATALAWHRAGGADPTSADGRTPIDDMLVWGCKTGANGANADKVDGFRYALQDELEIRAKGADYVPPSDNMLLTHFPIEVNSNALRGRITSLSGVRDMRPPLPGVTRDPLVAGGTTLDTSNYRTTQPRAWLDPNYALTHVHNPPAGETAVVSSQPAPFLGFVNRMALGPNPLAVVADDYPVPPYFQQLVPTATARGLEYSKLMLNVWYSHMCGKDNVVAGDLGWYGYKPLPMLTEAYLQRRYFKVASSGAGPYTVDCSARGSDMGWAVEVVNPFGFPLMLRDVHLYFHADGVLPAPIGAALTSCDLGALPTNPAGERLLPAGGKLIVWNRPVTLGPAGAAASAQDDVFTRIVQPAVTAGNGDRAGSTFAVQMTTVNLNLGASDGHQGTLRVFLDVPTRFAATATLPVNSAPPVPPDSAGADSNGYVHGYSQLIVPHLRSGWQEVVATNPAAIPVDGDLGYAQAWARGYGVGTGLNVLQSRPAQAAYSAANVLPAVLDRVVHLNYDSAYVLNRRDQALKLKMIIHPSFNGGNAGIANFDADTDLLGRDAKVARPAGRTDLAGFRWFQPVRDYHDLTPADGAFQDRPFITSQDLLRIPIIGPLGRYTTTAGSAPPATVYRGPLLDFVEAGTERHYVQTDLGSNLGEAVLREIARLNTPAPSGTHVRAYGLAGLCPPAQPPLDANNDGNFDVNDLDFDYDGVADLYINNGEDRNVNGRLDAGEDANGNGVIDPAYGFRGRGEDLDGDGILDAGEDTNGNGALDDGFPKGIENHFKETWNLPWGMALASQFRPDSPANDGVLESAAGWRPGLLNLNTATSAVMTATLPWLNNTQVSAIVAQRGAPSQSPNRKGLMLTDELMLKYSGGAPLFTADQLALLAQACATRSDVFIVTFVVQLYRKDDFSLGPVAARRVVALLGRNDSPRAELLAFLEIK